MSRPIKKGLSYFPLDTDILSDRKIRRLFQNYGCEGFSTYMAILCEAYGTTGYYVRYTDDFCFDIGFTLNLKEERVREIIGFCVEIRLFNRDLLGNQQAEHIPYLPRMGNPGRDRPYSYGRNIGSCYGNPGFRARNLPKRKRKRK